MTLRHIKPGSVDWYDAIEETKEALEVKDDSGGSALGLGQMVAAEEATLGMPPLGRTPMAFRAAHR